jgi:hypothetical protein
MFNKVAPGKFNICGEHVIGFVVSSSVLRLDVKP